jgi:hypothetical protein
MKNCIACAEEIKLEALLCRWCSTRQDDASFSATSQTPQADEFSEKSISKTASVTAHSFDPGRWPKEDEERAQGLPQQEQLPMSSEHLKPLRWPEEEKAISSRVNQNKAFGAVWKHSEPAVSKRSEPAANLPRGRQGNFWSTPIVSLVSLVIGVALVLSGLAYTYNPNYQRSVDGWLTNVFSDTGSYFDAGYSDAKNNNADRNSSLGYANTYCSVITNAQYFPSTLARQEYFRGCISYTTSP